KHFGSVAQIKQASAEELTAVPGIGPALAQKILAALT
ncbi:MAG: helix-hairpin-helix domain-containing protein, partial [Rothia mucilaginosa]